MDQKNLNEEIGKLEDKINSLKFLMDWGRGGNWTLDVHMRDGLLYEVEDSLFPEGLEASVLKMLEEAKQHHENTLQAKKRELGRHPK